MTAALVMPDRQERPVERGDPGGVWFSPNALAQLFSFHVIKDLNFLSQVIKLSVTETLQPGVLTKVQLKSKGSQTEQPASVDAAAEAVDTISMDNVDAQQDQQSKFINDKNATNSTASVAEDWDTELPQDLPEPPRMSHIYWEDNPRMKKLYKRKREVELARQKELDEERMQFSSNSESENVSSQSSLDEHDSNGNFTTINRTNQLNMNKVVKGGRKLFVRNVNFKTTQHKLWDFFKKFGRVRACELIKERGTRRSRGIAFVTFDKQEECEKVLSASREELTLQGWMLEVELARPRKKEPSDTSASQCENLSQETESIEKDDQGNMLDEPNPAPCDALTDDAFLHIFSFLEIRQLTTCERVCKKWRKLALQAWKSKQSVTLQGLVPTFHSVDDRALRSMLSKCSPSLTNLDLSVSARSLSDHSLETIARCCPNVQDIHLVSLQITNKGFEGFVKKCNKIQKIEVEHCDNVREDGIWRLFNSCRDLREVYLNDCKRISGQCFHVMAGGIVTLSLNGCTKLQDVAMSKLSMRCKNLQELHLNGCTSLTDVALDNLAKNEVMDTLQVLSLSKFYPHMSTEGLQRICEFVNLQELYLSENNFMRDETLQKICMACTTLRVLDIGGCGPRITDSGLNKLPASLEYLTISYLSSVTDEGLEIIADNCPKLRSLKARFCHDITDTGLMSVIVQSMYLREMDVCGCFNVTNLIVNGLIEEQKMRDPTHEKILVIAGGTSIVASELSLPPSITLNTFAFNPTAPDFDTIPYDFESEEEDSFEDDFDDLLLNDDPFLVSEMELS